jgi:CDGSH-type Zn-finger protein
MAYRKLRIDLDIVDVVGHILDLRVVLAIARDRRGSALERGHGGERSCSGYACACRCGSEGNWPHCSGAKG